MAKNINARQDIYDIFTRFKKVSKEYINEVLEDNGYAETSNNKKEALDKSRRNIIEDLITNGYIESTKDSYIVTSKLLEILDKLKELSTGSSQDIRNAISKLNEASQQYRNGKDNMLCFSTIRLLTSPHEIVQKEVRKLKACLEFIEIINSIESELSLDIS